MLEMVVFAVVLVAVQVFAGLLLVRVCMSEWFMKKYMRMMKKYMNRLMEMEFEDED